MHENIGRLCFTLDNDGYVYLSDQFEAVVLIWTAEFGVAIALESNRPHVMIGSEAVWTLRSTVSLLVYYEHNFLQ